MAAVWVATLTALLQTVNSTPFSEYIIAPASRTVYPLEVYGSTGTVENVENLCSSDGMSSSVIGPNSSITLDYGKNIAGTVHFTIDSVDVDDQFIGFTFTESSMWISPYHCDSGTDAIFDDPLWFPVPNSGQYGADKTHQRGAFRYMSLWHNSTGQISISNVYVNFTASPELASLQQYDGYFNSDSEKLNRAWYAGAYTNQICTLDPAYGNALGVPGSNWYYNASIANGTSVLSDGGKRDRLVWPGDIAISAPSMFVSVGSLDGSKNGIDSLFLLQQPDGRLPWAGAPFTGPGRFQFSFTYHLYTLLDEYYYHLFTGDDQHLVRLWPQYKLALEWSLDTIDETGMANVTATNDWLRSGMGGHNVEANSILYHVLDVSRSLAQVVGDEAVIPQYELAMQGVRNSINQRLWDPAQGLFYDNDTIQNENSVHPQDGNSWAIIAGIADPDRASSISAALAGRWVRPYGAPAPEAGPTISPFASGFELQAHYLSGHPERAVELMEFMWADFMLDDPRMTNSSFIEGYSTNGSLHYAPYDNDARISHAHGWATGPTSSLSFYSAGLHLTSSIGKTWLVKPLLGGLGRVSAGYTTPLGSFNANWTARGGGLVGSFETPTGTSGVLVLPGGGPAPVLTGEHDIVAASNVSDTAYTYSNLAGGKYTVTAGQGWSEWT